MDSLKAAEGNDDGLLLLVVGDEATKTKQGIKMDPSADDAEMVVETLEEYIDDLKSEVKTTEDDSDNSDEIYLPNLCDETSEEEIPEFEGLSVVKRASKNKKKHLTKQHKSYVSDLRKRNPQLQEDEELLIDTLSQIMANFKCPAPPPNSFLQKDNKFECANCKLKKDTKMAVARHWQDRHGPRCFVCYACGDDFRSQTNLYKHEKRCVSDDAIVLLKARGRIKKYKGTCPGRPFHLPEGYHKKKPSFINCLRISNPSIVQDREKLVQMLCEQMSQESPPEPPEGSVVFIDDENMNQCTTCRMKNVSRNALLRHWQWAHGPRYLTCYACGITYTDPRNLYKHEKRCTDPDACAVLEARARVIGARREGGGAGRGGEEQDKSHPCGECPAVYKNLKYLKAHQLSHLGLRPYRCEVCPAQYTSSNALYRHREVHKGNNFLCNQCARTFKTHGLLKSHLNSHLPQRKYGCPQCEKRYAQKWALQVHIDREHLKLPPRCACQICPKRYPRMSLLKDHMLKKHGMTLITRRMLYRNLPTLTESQLKSAKVVKKSDLDPVQRPEQSSGDNPKGENETDMSVGNQEIAPQDIDENVEIVEEDSTQKIVQQEKSETQIEEDNNNAESQISEEQDKDLLEYANKIQQADTTSTKPLIVIKDGQAIFMDKNNVDFYKRKLRKRKNSQVESFKQSLLTDVENLIENDPEPEAFITNNSINPMLQEEEVISRTNRVVTLKNCVSAEKQQLCQNLQQTPKIEARKRRKRRKQYLR